MTTKMKARDILRLGGVAAYWCYAIGVRAETANAVDVPVSETIALGRVDVVAELPKHGPYVGEPILLRIRSYVHGKVAQDQIIQPVLTNFNWQQFGIDESFYAMVDGVSTPVFERSVLVTPVLAGPLTIPPVVRHVTMINTDNQRIEVDFASKPLVIDVNTNEGLGHPGDWWLPAKSVKIIDSWDPAPDRIPSGETATRTITIEALGTTADRLPSPPLLRAAGIIAFAGPTERQTIVTEQGPLARAIYRWRVRPVSETVATIPELHIPWFDIATRQMRDATAPEREAAFLDSERNPKKSSRFEYTFHLLEVRPIAASAIAFVWSLAIAYLIATLGYGGQAWGVFFKRAPKSIRNLKRAARDDDVCAFRRAVDELARSEREAWTRVSKQNDIAAGLASVNAALFAPASSIKPVALRPLADSIYRAWRDLSAVNRK
jgi:hypothetical protein